MIISITYVEGDSLKVKLSEVDYEDHASQAFIWKVLNAQEMWPMPHEVASLCRWARGRIDSLVTSGVINVKGRRVSVNFSNLAGMV